MAEVISVSALNKYVHSLLDSDPFLGDIAIEGEISNFSRHYKTGHCYFTLKDAKAGVRAVMFRSAADELGFTPQDGMLVVVRGRVTLFERDGAFQLYAEYLFPSGEGALRQAFEQLKNRLEAEGLFDSAYKKPIPAWPGKIGLVTSKTGAALQDVLKVSQNNCGLAQYLLCPVSVQGANAAKEIADAIRLLDSEDDVDVILVTRGGGSAEDLWVFNDERIARAAFACETPLVSAVGHEVDTCILDFVADMRAPTPSAAAEMILPNLQENYRHMLYVFSNIQNNIQFRMNSWYNNLDNALHHPAIYGTEGMLRQRRDRLRHVGREITQIVHRRRDAAKQGLAASAALAHGLSPYAVLGRGYGVVRSEQRLVKRADGVKPGQALEVCLADGRIDCTADNITLEENPLHGG